MFVTLDIGSARETSVWDEAIMILLFARSFITNDEGNIKENERINRRDTALLGQQCVASLIIYENSKFGREYAMAPLAVTFNTVSIHL